MQLREFAGASTQAPRLAALAEFLAGRAQDSNAPKTISTKAFINLAKGLGISITDSQLRDLVQQSPLNALIDNVEGAGESGKILFRGSTSADTSNQPMTADQARLTVDQMAKRAAKKDL